MLADTLSLARRIAERPSDQSTPDELALANALLALRAPVVVGGTSLHEAALDALNEALSAADKWPPYNSAHEGYGVLAEEFDELKAHVWTNQRRRDLAAMRGEAVQVAAVALRFVTDVCSEDRGRR